MPVPVHFYHMVRHFMVILSQSMCLLICHGRSLLYRYVLGFFADTLLVLKIKIIHCPKLFHAENKSMLCCLYISVSLQ